MNKDELAFFAAVKSDLLVFLRQAFSTIYPSTELELNWHLDALVHGLEAAIKGDVPRLIINMPPRHLKSFITSVALPAFILGRDPAAKVICVSYSDDLAKSFSLEFKRIVESEWYRRVFPEVRFIKAKEGELVTDQGGMRYATSVGGTLTGRGGDIIIIDDPIKPEDAASDKARHATNNWIRSTLFSRLNDKQRSILILVMQRVHLNDLTGFVEATGGFHKLSFSSIATKNETIALRHGKLYQREAGEVLHEARESRATLDLLRRQIGEFNFASQYQQSPSVVDGSIFKRSYFKLHTPLVRMTGDGKLYVSVDSAASEADGADYSAISLVYVFEKDFYVISAERGRWDYEGLKEKVLGYRKRFGNETTFIVEAASTGHALIPYLLKNDINCFGYKPKTDKMARALRAIPILSEGRVHLLSRPGKDDWIEPYINEFINFPFGPYDDQVDTLTQLLPWADARHNGQGRFIGIPR